MTMVFLSPLVNQNSNFMMRLETRNEEEKRHAFLPLDFVIPIHIDSLIIQFELSHKFLQSTFLL